jgi:hypothetical protein
MKSTDHLLAILVLGSVLAACGIASQPGVLDTLSQTQKPSTQRQLSSPEQSPAQGASQELARTDAQGAVTIEVKPDNLSNPGEVLVFQISMNTHSVDLSMDLATLATLTTDNGNTVQASLWDAPLGGHHVSGMLSFPAKLDGNSFLDGATKLSLIIKDVDAPERIFTWDLQN